MQCKQNENTQMNTHSHIKPSANQDNPHLIPVVLARRYSKTTCLSLFTVQSTLSHVYSLYQLQYTHCITKKVTTFMVLHTGKTRGMKVFLDVQVQMAAKGDLNTMHVTIPFVTDLTEHPN
jgi:hypothetical protein